MRRLIQLHMILRERKSLILQILEESKTTSSHVKSQYIGLRLSQYDEPLKKKRQVKANQ